MRLSIILPVIFLVAAIGGGYFAYRRYIDSISSTSDSRQVNGARLTSERLHTLGSPWRIVFEIGDDRLGGVDHVAIGPAGVIAISTLMIDRPDRVSDPDPQQIALAAMTRGPVDELVNRVGMSCNTLAKVYWGAPQPGLPAALENGLATIAVEGQRLEEWLLALPAGPLTASQIDLAWQAVLTGIGRPDPFA